jgi:sulfur carrier protein
MKITLNNRPETLEEEKLTLQELIEKKNFTFKLLVTKINGKLIKKESRDKTMVQEGDEVAVIHLISGG